ncbi:alpha/beta hydrolase [Paenibacillus sp. sgz302251]|uniref:alpha/beta hydrolase n=1 Tax=Paenibacillus sp. sgz302251 TaxID=3414493 RepID=UPI003C7E6A1C
MSLVVRLVIIIVFIIVVLLVLAWKIGARSQKPRYIPNASKPDVETLWEEISFENNGSRMKGWLLQPIQGTEVKDGLLPLVVVAHGWGSNRTRVLRYTHPLYKAGFAVFVHDARSHGDSDAIQAPSAFMFRDDVRSAVETARRLPGIDPNRIAVLGHSLGGFGTLLALDKGLKVNSVITDSMPVRFETMLQAELKRKKIPSFPLAYLIPSIWLIRSGYSRAEYRAANISDVLKKHAGQDKRERTPVLMIHSGGDDFISADDLRQLERQLPEGAVDTLFVSTHGHSSSEQDPAFWERALPFLQKTLLLP